MKYIVIYVTACMFHIPNYVGLVLDLSKLTLFSSGVNT